MALLLYHLNRLPPPFDYLTESVFEIPAARGMRLANRHVRLIFVLGGDARLRLGEAEPVPLRAGDVVLLPCPAAYGYLPAVPGMPARLQALAISVKPSMLARQIAARFPRPVHLPGIQNAHMLHHLYQIRTEAENGQRDAPLVVGARATLLVLALLRGPVEKLSPARINRPSAYLVEQAREFIFKNHSGELTLAGIAWHLRLSEEYLARLFRRETGQTVFDYVREVRLNTAKQLLAGTNHSVTRIAEMAGFSSPTYFCRLFRRVFQTTPAGYRAARAGNPSAELERSRKSG